MAHLDLYTLGRVQSFVSLVAIAALIAAIARRIGLSSLASAAAVALIPAWLRLMEYALSFRPDAPQTALTLLAVWIALGGAPTRRRVFFALGCLWISMHFKPTSWGAIAALAFWIARGAPPSTPESFKRAALCIGAFIFSGLLAAFALDRAMGGRFFLNAVGSLDNGWRPSNVSDFYANVSPPAFLALFTGLLAALFGLRRTPASDVRAVHANAEKLRLFFNAALFSFAAATLQNLKVGADINYYLEPYALACVGAALAIDRLLQRPPSLARASGLAAVAAVALLHAAPFLWRTYWRDLGDSTRRWGQIPPFIGRAASFEGPILTTYPRAAIARPSPPTVLDQFQYRALARRGRLDARPLLDRIERREFVAIILDAADLERPLDGDGRPLELYAPEFFDLLEAHYRIAENLDGVRVLLLPK
jgi:hypothetical protein